MMVVAVLVVACASCSQRSASDRYRVSQDGTYACFYLFDNMALTRWTSATPDLHVNGTALVRNANWQLGPGHWQGRPDMVWQTGDLIDTVLVYQVESMAVQSDRRVIYGVGLHADRDRFFLIRNGAITWYDQSTNLQLAVQDSGIAFAGPRSPQEVSEAILHSPR